MTQRIIKFRAFDKNKKRFWDDIKCEFKGTEIILTPEEGVEINQFTGLKDLKGVEIYEGDLLQLSPEFTEEYSNKIFEVFWDEQMSGWSVIKPLGDYIVIGNIYENPELLTPKKGEVEG